MLPKVIIIGTMKGGTSALFRYLSSHNEMVGSQVKETNYFCKKEFFSKGIEWYESLFWGEGNIAFEASPAYTKRHLYPGTAERLHTALPDAKLIYLLRDPVSRAVSHYSHDVLKGKVTKDLSEALRLDDNYVKTSSYFYQIEAYLERFDPAQILLLQSERLRNDRDAAMNEISRFIGIEPDFDPNVVDQDYHVTKERRKTTRIEYHLWPYFNHRYINKVFKSIFVPLRTPFEPPKLSEEDRDMLREKLSPDIEKLRGLTGKEFKGWQV
ncbi:MAG: hypothetical protein DWQ47_08290 [Acidobacteria bacterium]|nr:MAG: hypothetical protein DWQ32_16390 [Acidobacteriota bacterium]REJ99091.1 MAG: hypothetical protein DWQ38_13590 [Acidobacteriota bacterium]REK16189.1 MAG: hypothetical protein DWQ43_04100 [Acidobacteriota bacterium]REK43870.1 MAG: hypothetical protein DWQ47_08290 [Acidobacteriota bacterium]